MLDRVAADPGSDESEHLQRGSVPWRRRLRRGIAVAAVVLLLPVPWQHRADSGLGLAWGMDNRLVVEGERLDPPGRYSWLTAGRPPLVAEALWYHAQGLVDPDTPPVARDLRIGSAASRPVNVTPSAAAVGLAIADGGLPEAGDVEPVDAVLGGHGPPYSWIRSMSMGSSHGLMVGLVSYAATVEEDLTGGRHVGGTGQLSADGSVERVSELRAKASGARRAGIDVLLVPASQQHELHDMDLGDMQVIGVHSLQGAIEQLRATRPSSDTRD